MQPHHKQVQQPMTTTPGTDAHPTASTIMNPNPKVLYRGDRSCWLHFPLCWVQLRSVRCISTCAIY